MFRINCQADRWPARPLGIGLILATVATPLPAQADRIVLRGGGQINGKLIADPADPDHLTFVGEAGKNPIIYKKEQILQVNPVKSVLDEYVVRRGRDRTVGEEEYQLGVWCEEHKLRDLAGYHFEAALRLDPNYGPAHERLGHTQVDDRWLNADELREAQGQVKFRGRWMMPEEKARLEDQANQAAEGQSWTRRIKQYRDAFVAGRDVQAKDAERRLLAIREAAAVGPVTRILGLDPNPNVRDLGSRVLGAIQGPESSTALVNRLLAETDGTVRENLIVEVARRDPAEVVPRLGRALQAKEPDVINRAAWALGRLNAVATVPQLISALIFTEYRTEYVPVAVAVGGGGGGGINASFGSGTPAGGVGLGNYASSSYATITPPAVAPGVVAFGITGVPLVNGVALGNGGGTGLGVGGGNDVRMIPRVVPIDHPNVEVLAALSRLTGKDFGYDVGVWKQWAAASFRSDRSPARRVVQP